MICITALDLHDLTSRIGMYQTMRHMNLRVLQPTLDMQKLSAKNPNQI